MFNSKETGIFTFDRKEPMMKRYAVLLAIAAVAAALAAGCSGSAVRPTKGRNVPATASCVTLEFTFKEITESETGGGAIEEKVRMKLIQRVTIGSEFETHDEKTVSYEEDVEGIKVPVTGLRMFTVGGVTKLLGDSRKFSLNAELRYIDEPEKINFSAKPSAVISMDSAEEIVISESGSITVTLKVTAPEETTYPK